MKKKIVAVLLSAAMVMAMAVGCSSGKPAEKAEGGKAGTVKKQQKSWESRWIASVL